MNQNFMKEKKILPLVLSMSLPMVISMAVNSLYNIVDSYFVAKVSENAMTALALIYPIQNLITAIAVGFGIGINAVIAYYMGSNEQEKANRATTQGLFLSVIHGILMTLFSIIGMPFFLKMFTPNAQVTSLALRYSNIAFAFSIIISLGISFRKDLSGSWKNENFYDQYDLWFCRQYHTRSSFDFWYRTFSKNGN